MSRTLGEARIDSQDRIRAAREPHHGEAGIGTSREGVTAGAVDAKQSADVAGIDLIHILSRPDMPRKEADKRVQSENAGSVPKQLTVSMLAASTRGLSQVETEDQHQRG